MVKGIETSGGHINVTPLQTDNATYFEADAVSTAGTEVLAAGERSQGVWLINETAQAGEFGDAAGTAIAFLPASMAVPFFIPGNGAIFVKATATTTNVSGWWV